MTFKVLHISFFKQAEDNFLKQGVIEERHKVEGKLVKGYRIINAWGETPEDAARHYNIEMIKLEHDILRSKFEEFLYYNAKHTPENIAKIQKKFDKITEKYATA